MAVRHVLLLVQGALAALVAAETLLLSLVLHSAVLLAVTVVAAAGAALPVVLAFRLMRGRRRARGLTVAYEVLLLVSGCVNATLLGNSDLVSVLVTLVLPLVLLWLLRRPSYSPQVSETTG
jgi:hypothetical protein